MTTKYTLATDGSCLYHDHARPTTGGWAAILAGPDGLTVRSGALQGTGSAEMELQAVVEGLRLVPEGATCEVLTDFQCLTNWIARFRRTRPAQIADALAALLPLLQDRRVTFTIVRRHDLHRRAHCLARATARAASRNTIRTTAAA